MYMFINNGMALTELTENQFILLSKQPESTQCADLLGRTCLAAIMPNKAPR